MRSCTGRPRTRSQSRRYTLSIIKRRRSKPIFERPIKRIERTRLALEYSDEKELEQAFMQQCSNIHIHIHIRRTGRYCIWICGVVLEDITRRLWVLCRYVVGLRFIFGPFVLGSNASKNALVYRQTNKNTHIIPETKHNNNRIEQHYRTPIKKACIHSQSHLLLLSSSFNHSFFVHSFVDSFVRSFVHSSHFCDSLLLSIVPDLRSFCLGLVVVSFMRIRQQHMR